MSLRRIVAEYFIFTRTERTGIRALLALLLLLLTGILVIPFVLPHPQTDYSRFDAMVAEFLADTLPEQDTVVLTAKVQKEKEPGTPGSLQPFDPNGLAVEQWMALGLSRRQAESIKKYEQAGGKFRTKEDVKKMYVISEDIYTRIEPYILIAAATTPLNTVPEKTTSVAVLDLNTATAEELQTIRGIGEKLGPRIVMYREKLGGFYAVEQLHDVYGLSQETYDKIAPSLKVGSVALKKININYAGVEELGRHPCIGFDLAYKIVSERNRGGFFKDPHQIVTRGLADEQVYAKLVHYITIE